MEVSDHGHPPDYSFLYRKNLSRAMAELLADPFSELTRKRQPALLIAATVALLLSAGLAKVKELEVGGAKFELTPPHVAIWIAVAITGYLLISYILGVWADWSIAKAKRWSPLAKIRDVNAAMDEDQKARAQAGKARSEEAHSNVDELPKIQAEIQQRRDAILARQEEIDSAPSEERAQLAQESDDLQLAESALDRESRDRTDPLVHRGNDIVQSISFEPGQSMWAERADINKTVRTFSRLTYLRLVLEIIFPAAYALFALIWTIRHV